MEKVKKPLLLFSFGVALAYISAIPFYSGSFLGYILAKFFSGKSTACQGRLKSIILNVGTYRIHLHHWFISVLIILGLLIKGICLSEFLLGTFGFLAGLIFQGIYHYQDWHRILIKKEILARAVKESQN